jgi:hypothetical protein
MVFETADVGKKLMTIPVIKNTVKHTANHRLITDLLFLPQVVPFPSTHKRAVS